MLRHRKVNQVGRTARQMTYFLSSRAMWRVWCFCHERIFFVNNIYYRRERENWFWESEKLHARFEDTAWSDEAEIEPKSSDFAI